MVQISGLRIQGSGVGVIHPKVKVETFALNQPDLVPLAHFAVPL